MFKQATWLIPKDRNGRDFLERKQRSCSTPAIQTIGLLDEDFTMYYEDSEWSYRARLLGFTIAFGSNAVVYHAFSAQLPVAQPPVGKLHSNQTAGSQTTALTRTKLRRVVYGRLRFITRINGGLYYWRFLFTYLLEDLLQFLGYLILLRPKMAASIVQGFADYLSSLPGLLPQRAALQPRRQLSDKELYSIQRSIPVPLIYAGAPLLTWDAITFEFLPLILSGRTRKLPEFEEAGVQQISGLNRSVKTGKWKRWIDLGQVQGLVPLLKQLARRIQWRLMQP